MAPLVCANSNATILFLVGGMTIKQQEQLFSIVGFTNSVNCWSHLTETSQTINLRRKFKYMFISCHQNAGQSQKKKEIP
jgi:hypothetical protein